ncbi:MAG: OmpH family outer membrane protein [candidate division WOR-3 bacterium]
MVKNFFLFVFFPVFLFALETKIGIVDLKRITENYEGMKEAKGDIERLVKEWEGELNKKRAKIDSLQRLYEGEKPGLSPEARLKREKDLENLKREYQNFIKEIWGKDGRLEQKTKERIQPITEKIRKVIREIAQEENVDIIFDSSKDDILYAKDVIDLTDRVLERLNMEYKGKEIAETGIIRRLRVSIFPFKLSGELVGSIYPNIFMNELEKGIRKSPKFDVTGSNVSENSIKSIGYDRNTLPEAQIPFVITQLGVDYALYGELKKKGSTEIEVNFYIYNIKGEKVFENTITFTESEEKIKEGAYSVAQSVINYFSEGK